MPKINTHLHLAQKLSKRIRIANLDSFFLGNVFPDCWHSSLDRAVSNHYKSTPSSLCDLQAFTEDRVQNDFNLGYFFHLWIDNRMAGTDTGDISREDCMICDMEVIAPIIQQLKGRTFENEELQAVQNLRLIETEPVLTCIVPEEKRIQYDKLLDALVDAFLEVLE